MQPIEPTWGDILANYFKDAAMVLLPIIMAYFSNWLRKLLKRYHMTMFQGMIERHAQELLLAETNKAALALTGEGNKIQWSGVIAESVKQLAAAHKSLTPEEAESMVQAVMLRTPSIGPIDQHVDPYMPCNARTIEGVDNGQGNRGSADGSVPSGEERGPYLAGGKVIRQGGPLMPARSDPAATQSGGTGGGDPGGGAPDSHYTVR